LIGGKTGRAWASAVAAGEDLRQAWPAGAGAITARRAEQPLLSDGFACEVIGIIKERYCDFGPTLAAARQARRKPNGSSNVWRVSAS
jgi:hypothetical protein